MLESPIISVRGHAAQRAAGLEQRQRIGLAAREGIAAESEGEEVREAGGFEQRARSVCVVDAGEAPAGIGELLVKPQPRLVDNGSAAVRHAVVALVGRPGAFVLGFAAPTCASVLRIRCSGLPTVRATKP